MAKTRYVWDWLSDNYLMEKDDTGTTVVRYTHEPDEFGQLISEKRQASRYYYRNRSRAGEAGPSKLIFAQEAKSATPLVCRRNHL
jgi:hypothetical protein